MAGRRARPTQACGKRRTSLRVATPMSVYGVQTTQHTTKVFHRRSSLYPSHWRHNAVRASLVLGALNPSDTKRQAVEFCTSAASACLSAYSHSIVLGGLDEMSYTTRLTPGTSLIIRVESRSNTSCGRRLQSAVIPSRLVTTRRATTLA